MLNDKDIEKLLSLARMAVSEEEKQKLKKDVESILGYVSDIEKVSLEKKEDALHLKNVMREDANPHESGLYTEAILNEAPKRKGEYIAVKKIL